MTNRRGQLGGEGGGPGEAGRGGAARRVPGRPRYVAG